MYISALLLIFICLFHQLWEETCCQPKDATPIMKETPLPKEKFGYGKDDESVLVYSVDLPDSLEDNLNIFDYVIEEDGNWDYDTLDNQFLLFDKNKVNQTQGYPSQNMYDIFGLDENPEDLFNPN
ncbi:uncharacterized protein LOC109609143 [Aethina tumida]|uniref:uncharacterized protein LOC109609143 n=1 Tax=Aethina tumida TaxID=116153 RepID=UPI00096ADD11|nr:uncharacterized protein LOC109609143 [Aethina tumida]XP_049817399.1 uncharacterized protein LOC109609143 [Aethina tumida]